MRTRPRTVEEIYATWPEDQGHGHVFEMLQEIAVQLAGLRNVANLAALAEAVSNRAILEHIGAFDEPEEEEEDLDLADAGRPAGPRVEATYTGPGRIIPFPPRAIPLPPRWPWDYPDPRFGLRAATQQ